TETCEKELPHLITTVQTDEAVLNDNHTLPQIHCQLAQAQLLPNLHLSVSCIPAQKDFFNCL
ncbi:MAG: hypothetical protein AB7G75_26140, partial [Candidatus Binatia bacterium]